MACLTACFSPIAFGQGKNPASESETEKIIAQGRVYCLDESGQRLSENRDCSTGSHTYELVSKDKKVFKFAADDLLTAMFKESRVRKLDLQITGEPRANNFLEITNIQTIRDGKLIDIFYYCDVCSITALGPGDCPCCFNPLEYREKPALEKP
ncbi:MAG: hypothetical protein AB1757_14785 [Acidobacteriota bacterium]